MEEKIVVALLKKINADGDVIWVRGLSGNRVQGHGIALDEFNNVYTTGEFGEEMDFDPGIGYNFRDGSISDNIFHFKTY